MAVTKPQAEAVIVEALSRPTRGLLTINYTNRIRIEAIAMLPLVRSLVKPILVTWWLAAVRYWLKQLTQSEIQHAIDLMVEKNRIYGCKQLHALGTFGILVRSFDKSERINNIDAGLRTHLLADESRRDSVMDNFNYAILAVLLLKGEL